MLANTLGELRDYIHLTPERRMETARVHRLAAGICRAPAHFRDGCLAPNCPQAGPALARVVANREPIGPAAAPAEAAYGR